MPGKKPNEKNTKAEILQAYEELLQEQAELKSQLAEKPTSAKEPSKPEIKPEPKVEPKPEIKPNMTQTTTIQQKMNHAIQNLANIQLGFGSAANELSEH